MAITDLRYAATLLKQGFTVSDIKAIINLTEQPVPDPEEQPVPDPEEQPVPDPEEQSVPDPEEQPVPDPEEQHAPPKENPLHRAETNHAKPDLISQFNKIF